MTDFVDIGPVRGQGPAMARMALGGAVALGQAQRGALMPWSAVMLGLGVALYFALPQEPGALGYAVAGVLLLAGAAVAVIWRAGLGPLGVGVAMVALGVLAAGHRAHVVTGPVLDFRYYGPIEGRVVGVDRSASDATRLTLDQVRLADMAPARTPRRVRIALHGDQAGAQPQPGSIVMVTGHLSAPSGPAEPGGFDFQRHSYFLSLGGVGYTRTPLVLLAARVPGETRLLHLRMRLSAEIQDRIAGQPGAFAAAVLTGDRSGLEAGPTQAMRDANIAHLLAISGLHMGLLTGFVYGALRLGLALIPALALRFAIRKWVATGALVAGAFYLALSGGNVATERAFIQVAVMFAAVLLDRRAITLRSVAIAAIIVLLNRPETLMSPGFQMSFAATAALVWGFGALRETGFARGWPGWAKAVLALVVSSVVAGAATAPFAAAHFNQYAAYGLLANLLTVPVMGSVIIPGAVVAVLLTPIGLAAPVWWVMERALIWILGVADWVAALPGAVLAVPTPPGWMLGVVTMGALVVLLWQGRTRWLGLVPILLALLNWQGAGRPDVLVSDSGGMVGILSAEGRVLSRARGDGFVAGVWLENDGDRVGQQAAAARALWQPDGAGQVGGFAGLRIWHGTGRRAAEAATEACATHHIVILSEPAPEGADAPHAIRAGLAGLAGRAPLTLAPDAACVIFDGPLLETTGALAIALQEGAVVVTSARMLQGDRPWSPVRRDTP